MNHIFVSRSKDYGQTLKKDKEQL